MRNYYHRLTQLPEGIKQYLLITANYWAFTLTDGALRMLVVLYFHQLGYDALQIALLFVFYEIFGVVTNLLGGWLGARLGLNKTMNIGLFLQVIALCMLAVPAQYLTILYVMAAQALCGIAKDLNKMSAKSAIKSLIPADEQGKLYRAVAALTGSKNTLKGIGFFLGGLLLSLFGFKVAVLIMAVMLSAVWLFSIKRLNKGLGKSKLKPKFKQIFSSSANINLLSAARLFLFGARDVWFVVALPIYLAQTFNWDHWYVSALLACWVIIYGLVQSQAPHITSATPGAKNALHWSVLLLFTCTLIALTLHFDFYIQQLLIVELLIFGAVFAVNSAVHSYLIVSYATADGTSLDIGFYYAANALGRLIGTVLSGWVYLEHSLEACLWVSALFVAISVIVTAKLSSDDMRNTAQN
ncbi:MAG: organoarsenical effux MFS transporter ArsJ [Oceanospirillaceae bacterium]|nr:organoarsenical effux MFS transporter ArsJ [Oceanospirillaceae bacterium]